METNFNPRVSIIIPVYNGANFLKKAIDSAINQTYNNIEIIVVNDGSTDNNQTENIAMSYGNKIRYFKKINGGVSSALNLGIKNMTGDYFSWLSHDDMYYAHKIEEQIRFINEKQLINQDVILYGDYSIINEKDEVMAICRKNHKEIEKKPEYTLLRGNLNGITILIPKKAFNDFGEFDETLKCTQDYDMWKKMMKKYKFMHQETVLSMTRIHENQDTIVNPKVETEGNILWINLIEDVPDSRKIELEGSIYKYYKEMIKFLEQTPYKKAKEHCINKIHDLENKLEREINSIKVSVIIPFLNRQDLTINAVKSIQNQTYQNIEIILINDGSTEDTHKLEELIKKETRIKYIKSEKNYGTGYSRNLGIKNATGEYIAFLDSDDVFLPTKIEKQLKHMVLNNGIFSHTSYIKKSDDGSTQIIKTGEIKGNFFPSVIGGCTIATPTVMVKRDYLIANNIFYPNTLSLGEDICFYIKLLEKIDILGIEEPLSIIKTDTTSTAYNYEKQLKGLKNIIAFTLKDEKTNIYNFELYRLFNEFIRVYDIKNGINNQLVEQIKQNERLNRQITEIQNKYENAEKMIVILERQISDLKQSTSWKFTLPFRKITMLIRNLWRKIKNRRRK